MVGRHIAYSAPRVMALVAVFISPASSESQAPALTIPRARAEELYELAAARFDSYERAHGAHVTTPTVRMHYLQWGDASGVPLIWAPGTFSSAYEMAPFGDALVRLGYRVIAIDYYGHGQTPIPERDVSLWHVADDVAALMDSLDIAAAVIGGWSRGGAIAAAFYDAYPVRVLGLALEDGGSFSFVKSWDTFSDDELDRTLFPGGSVSPLVEFTSAREAFVDAIQWNRALDRDDPLWALHTYSLIGRGDDGAWLVNGGLREWLQEDTRSGVLNLVRRPSLTPLFQWSLQALVPAAVFRHLEVPVLIIDPVDSPDRFPVSDQNRELQRMHPSLVIHRVYENTSHAAKLERPDQFIEDMRAFLVQIALRAPAR